MQTIQAANHNEYLILYINCSYVHNLFAWNIIFNS
jgi:hypothetical protein